MEENDFIKLVQECLTFSSSVSSSISSSFLTVLELMISKEIRDFDYSTLTKQLYTNLIRAHFNSDLSDCKEDLPSLYPFIYWALLVDLPECNHEDLASHVDQDTITIAFQALTGHVQCSKPLQRFYLKWITWLYAHNTSCRSKLRVHVGKALSTLAFNYNPRADITGLLNLLTKIIEGMQIPVQKSVCDHICYGILAPLHIQNGMTAWRDQEPILKTYHNALVCCEIALIEKDLASSSSSLLSPSSIPVVCALILEILKIWPDKFDTNTPKEIILLVSLFVILHVHVRMCNILTSMIYVNDTINTL